MKKKIFWLAGLLVALVIGLVLIADCIVKNAGKGFLFTSTAEIPHNKVGLVLGTSKYLRNGQENLYYRYRIEAATQLYKNGKVDFLLISGDNSNKGYDEPTSIKNDLIANGIPEHRIYLDYAGFRTLDSVVRCKAVFGQESITVISQPFHNERALYLAKCNNIAAVGFNADDVTAYYGFKTQIREKLARVKMLLDLAFGKKPKFLGEQIDIK